MATQAMSAHSIGALRLGLTGAITASLIFILCWVGTLVPFSSPTHAYIGLFTPAETNSFLALCEGAAWSFLFGGLSGALFALIYNALAGLERR